MLELLAQAPSAADKDANYGTLIALVIFIAASVWLGTLAQRVVKKSSFVKGFFLGNRGLGAWAVALTATVQSGGTFMGFPSLVYTHGWIVALWIGSYMVVPITGFGLIGKRIAHISRHTGAITMPDLFRARFASPTLGLITSLLIIVFMSAMMVAQFKAGATVMKLAAPSGNFLSLSEDAETQSDQLYWIGLAVFSITVVGYTLIGGFLAAVWTDLFQSVMMFIGVLALLGLSLYSVGGLEKASRGAVVSAQQAAENAEARRAAKEMREPQPVSENAGLAFISGPGFSNDGRQYLPLTLAVSFFFFWPATGFASPASVTRIMACKDTRTLRRSVVLLCAYNLGIYLPLIAICICARSLMPDLEKPDEVIPRMAMKMTDGLPGGSLLAGVILAAPFGAIMATVSSYLVVISSGLVRDVYQRFINPHATDRQLQWLARCGMLTVGVIAVVLNIRPVVYLQTLVVFASGGAGACFIVPCLMLCYWRRATAVGVGAAMLSGAATMITVYTVGMFTPDPMIGPIAGLRPFYPFGFEPLIFGVLISAVVGIVVSLNSEPPAEEIVSPLFDAPPLTTEPASPSPAP
ncbi:Sodium/pantothenate symporter [Anatilimnocola aggregata]|uniref:Sodium/pantothenate symporter n=1 Tax=Anatilimnocola aggregata TaxID=2528021 RepID=A0A517Y6Y9_9BACT|nr:sodium:solute symporter [Anatilimnocola aggregata]QDU25985.1 Sodium/pantothenate symporter [Anatilimnocola aggregata]